MKDIGKVGLILATRYDRNEDVLIVLDRVGPECMWLLRRSIQSMVDDHKKQTNIDGQPVYRAVWFLEVEIPKEQQE